MNIIKLIKAVAFRVPIKKNRYCVYCRHYSYAFIPFKKGRAGAPPLMQALECIGSDIDNFECPWCGATDRERHLYLYLKAADLLSKVSGAKVLHFAPEKRLSRLIIGMNPALYIPCDLYPVNPSFFSINIMSIPFRENVFDFIIANHVFEHIDNIFHALSEVQRVLRPGGYAILQTPYSNMLQETWSDRGINTKQAREQAFGQGDHVRFFGRDIFQLFTVKGLINNVTYHDELLKGVDALHYGVNSKEPFFLFQKTAAPYEK